MSPPDLSSDVLLDTPFVPRIAAFGVTDWLDAIGYKHPPEVVGTEREYHAIRNAAGAMDLSFIHKTDVEGPGAVELVNGIVTRDLLSLAPERIAYAAVLNEDGGMVDDVTVYVFGPTHVRVAGGTTDVRLLLAQRAAGTDITVTDRRGEIAQLCIQGPRSRDILSALTDEDVSNAAFPYYTYRAATRIAGIPAHVNRMGFTAELGYEIWVHPSRALELWDAVFAAGQPHGLVPVGAGAIMQVRTESGMIMGDGFDHDATITPWECRMGWATDLDAGDFRGRDAVIARRESAPYRLVTVQLDTDDDELFFAPLHRDGPAVGRVGMTVHSPILGSTLALARVESEAAAVGTELVVVAPDGRRIDARVLATPVYDPERRRVRS